MKLFGPECLTVDKILYEVAETTLLCTPYGISGGIVFCPTMFAGDPVTLGGIKRSRALII